jgi:hypothetical protein
VRERTSWHYARLKSYLRNNGTAIPENDIWIAPCALEVDAPLLTQDHYFEPMPKMSVLWKERCPRTMCAGAAPPQGGRMVPSPAITAVQSAMSPPLRRTKPEWRGFCRSHPARRSRPRSFP